MQNWLPKIKKYGLYTLGTIGALTVIWFIFIFAAGGFSSFRRSTYVGSGGYGGLPDAIQAPGFAGGDFLAERGGDETTQSGNVQPPAQEGQLTQRKVVKNGSLSLLVKQAEEVAKSIEGIAVRLNGFVQNSQVYEVSAGVKSGTVTIRVPASRFSEAVDEIKKLAVKVERETVNAQDVTEQFVDLEAQLKNFRAEENQYLRIMERAFTVDETLKVAQRLATVRGNIERIQGQLQYLSRQVDMSTIIANLTAEADIEVFGIRWRPLFVIKQAFRNLLTGLTGYVNGLIVFIFTLPIYLLWIATIVVVAIVAWRILRWVWKKFFLHSTEN